MYHERRFGRGLYPREAHICTLDCVVLSPLCNSAIHTRGGGGGGRTRLLRAAFRARPFVPRAVGQS